MLNQEIFCQMKNQIHILLQRLLASKQNIEDIKIVTKRKTGLQAPIKVIQDGWPEQRESCHPPGYRILNTTTTN